MRVYDATPMGQFQTSYGSFNQPGGAQPQEPVIDADELEQWYRMDSPERPEDPQNPSGDNGSTGGAR